MNNKKNYGFKSAFDFQVNHLAKPLETIAEQQSLLTIIRAALPLDIAEQINHCVLSTNSVLLYTKAACWGSQIRFFRKDILNKLVANGHHNICNLQVRIIFITYPQYRLRTASLPSEKNIDSLNKDFLKLENDDVLKTAMLRLAKTLEKRLQTKAQT